MAVKARVVAALVASLVGVLETVGAVLILIPAAAALVAYPAIVQSGRLVDQALVAVFAVRMLPRTVPAQAALVAEIFFERRPFE